MQKVFYYNGIRTGAQRLGIRIKDAEYLLN